MKNDNLYIEYLLDSITKIQSFVNGINQAVFTNDQKTQSAVIMQLLLIGETVKKLSEDTKNKIDLPWRDIAGFRDVAIHNYFDVDLDIVWKTIVEDIPTLKEKLSEFQK